MGIREQGYWCRQADALDRQRMASMAYAIGFALASGPEQERAIEALELTRTAQDSKAEMSKATWDLMTLFGGGKGV